MWDVLPAALERTSSIDADEVLSASSIPCYLAAEPSNDIEPREISRTSFIRARLEANRVVRVIRLLGHNVLNKLEGIGIILLIVPPLLALKARFNGWIYDPNILDVAVGSPVRKVRNVGEEAATQANQQRDVGHARVIVEEGNDRVYTGLAFDPVASRAAVQRSPPLMELVNCSRNSSKLKCNSKIYPNFIARILVFGCNGFIEKWLWIVRWSVILENRRNGMALVHVLMVAY